MLKAKRELGARRLENGLILVSRTAGGRIDIGEHIPVTFSGPAIIGPWRP
jgi:hypothetical protein